MKLVAMECRAVEGAWRIADTALEVSGGFGMFKKSEMERLLSGRASRPLPSGEFVALARADWQNGARHQP